MTRGKKNGSDVADLTLEVLKGLREDLRTGLAAVRQEIQQTNGRLDQTNERLDRLERRQNESELRLSSELVAVATAVGQVRDLLATRLDVRDRVVEHEGRLQVIERKLDIAK